MKYLLFVAALISTRLSAQAPLTFNKRFVESEDKWVAFPPEKDSSYVYGFIYIDEEAGLTLNYEGTFRISSTGEFIPKKLDSINMKVRLRPNNVLVAFIPENKYKELQITAVPDWLKYYETDTNSVERLYRWGFMYNSWEECAKALTYLRRAQKIDPSYKGLDVELAYSYNCLKQYGEAEAILEKAIQANPTDAYVNKEYIYALTKNNHINKAIIEFKASLNTLKDSLYNAENCYNILQYFYNERDKANFAKWYTEFQKYPNGNKNMSQWAGAMNQDLNK